MDKEQMIGPLLHRSSNNISRLLDQLTSEYQLTGKQGRIVGYLAHHQDRGIYQRDIETLFGIRRSSVSSLIDHLEKNGFLTRQEEGTDARLKRLVLTAKGVEVHEIIHEKIQEIERRILSLYTKEEYEQLKKMLSCLIEHTKE
ncbi:MAG: MarR family transcriptional regulator [Bacilli bacterium]